MLEPYVERGLEGAIWGFGAESGLHALAVIRSGAFDRFPNSGWSWGTGAKRFPSGSLGLITLLESDPTPLRV